MSPVTNQWIPCGATFGMLSCSRCGSRLTVRRILRLYRGGTGILKIGKALGIGTGTVQRVLGQQPRPFDVGVAEAAFASQ